MKRTVLFFALSIALAGCATIYNPATGRKETLLNSSIETALGKMALVEMGLVSLSMGQPDPAQLERVQRIGARVARVSDRTDVTCRFGLIREKTINAFAVPGGTIYVHSHLAELATDDELACVLAHEVGHVAARHSVKHLQADLGFSVLMEIASRSGAGGGGARVARSVYGLISSGYSRKDELEADKLGLKYAANAGYDPEAMISFFKKMQKETPETVLDKAAVWTRTHPLTSERIAAAQEWIDRLPATRFCPVCGAAYPAKDDYCPKDGTPLKKRSSP